MLQLSEYEVNAINKFGESVHNGKWSNEGLVKLIEQADDFLNIKTVPDYSKHTGISDVAARKDTFFRKNRTIFNTKYIIDNY